MIVSCNKEGKYKKIPTIHSFNLIILGSKFFKFLLLKFLIQRK